MNRIIAHIDMDAFFASVEQLDNREYKGKPVIIGADPKQGRGRGVVSAASYEARKFGIHSAMPISQAYRLCPEGIFLFPRLRRYSELSGKIMKTLQEFSPQMEQISIDEAFIDISGTEKLFGTLENTGNSIKRRIYNETGLTASVGIASNKSVAKIASDINKPDGLTICPLGEEREFLKELPVNRLWGAGKKTVKLLKSMGMKTIGDIAGNPMENMEKKLGKWGEHLWRLANGIDDRPVGERRPRKSISEEITFGRDTDDEQYVRKILMEIADRLSRNMRYEDLKGSTITLKIRLEGFETYTRSKSMAFPINDMENILLNSLELYEKFNRNYKKIRLVGIAVSNFLDNNNTNLQLNLFNGRDNNQSEKFRKKHSEQLMDELKKKYGTKITRAVFLNLHDKE